MAAQGVWSENLGEEAAFWERWLTADEFKVGREARIGETRPFSKMYLELAGAKPGATVRVLDIGSGPVSTLGSVANGYKIELICADALADSYNALLERCGYSHLPQIQNVKREDLVSTYGAAAFDIVHCANALDHFEDPVAAFRNMYEACRPGGFVILISIENEGEREKYNGLHQWNLRADDRGVWLWNASINENLLDSILNRRSYAWNYTPGNSQFNVFRALIGRG